MLCGLAGDDSRMAIFLLRPVRLRSIVVFIWFPKVKHTRAALASDAAIVEALIGVKAERQSLESITKPLSEAA
jgi:hypothetical protein